MKIYRVKSKIKICVLIVLICASAHGQSSLDKGKLSFHSFSITPEAFYIDYAGGYALSGDLSYVIDKNIITFAATIGEEYTIWGDTDNFQQLNILYGREFKIKEKFFIETHAGIGALFYNYSDEHDLDIGLPFVVKFRFKTGTKFSMGPKFQANINSIMNIYSAGLLLQWNY